MSTPQASKKRTRDALEATPRPAKRSWHEVAKEVQVETQALKLQFDQIKKEKQVYLFSYARWLAMHLQYCCGG